MKPKSPQSIQLYNIMLRLGYPEEFADIVTKNLNTDFTATRMMGYLYRYSNPRLEDVADEMLAILDDRNRIMEKKELEEINKKWNELGALFQKGYGRSPLIQDGFGNALRAKYAEAFIGGGDL